MPVTKPFTVRVDCSRCGVTSIVSGVKDDVNHCPSCATPLVNRNVRSLKSSPWTVGRVTLYVLGIVAGVALHKMLGPKPSHESGSLTAPSAPALSLPTPAAQTPQPMVQGDVLVWQAGERVAPFGVVTINLPDSVYLKLVDASTNQPVMSFLILPGQEFRTTVPLGNYKVRYATGKVWYGVESLFGVETRYLEADRVIAFTQAGTSIQGTTIYLQRQINGNLPTRRIEASQF